MIVVFISLFFAAIYFGFILALRIGLSRLDDEREQKAAMISIIVAMKNEGQKVRACLESLVNQNYPKERLEIVVVDDGSTDETSQILAEYQSRYAFLKAIRHQRSWANSGGKKAALSKGIAASTGEILLFTDADCVAPADWASAMVAYFAPHVGLVVGFSPLVDPNDTLLGALLQIDSLVNGIVAAGSIGLGGAATCTGRNLAYRRQVYHQVNGFTDIMQSISGDDDLFLHVVHQRTRWHTRFALDKSSIVPSYQTKTIVDLFRQKQRHLSAGKYYPFYVKLAYFAFHISNLALHLIFLLHLVSAHKVLLATACLGAKFLADGLLIIGGGKLFNVHPAIGYFLLWEYFFVLYHVIIAPFSWFGRIRWK